MCYTGNVRGFIVLPLILVVAFIAVLAGVFVFSQKQGSDKSSPHQLASDSNPPGQKPPGLRAPEGGYGFKQPFWEEDGVSLQHYWPSEGSFSAEETEILLLNESDSEVEVKSFDLSYSVAGKTYPHKSGTWEKFPTIVSWDKVEYINIGKLYYQNQPLVLARGEKGKLHWHIQFGTQPLDGKQTVKVKLTLLYNGQEKTIDEEFNRDSGTVFSKDDH